MSIHPKTKKQGRTISTFYKLGWLALGLLFCLVIAAPVAASGIAQGYNTSDSGLQPGMAVELSANNTASTPSVERGTIEKASKIIGIATSGNDNILVSDTSKPEIFVQTSGDTNAYVTDYNGTVKKGDSLTISPLKGILMKAAAGNQVLLGTATQDFPSSTADSYQVQIGQANKNVLVAKMSINLDHATIVGAPAQSGGTLQRLGKSLTGHDIGTARVAVALVIFILVIVAEGDIIYGAVSSAITSLGRNPLAGATIKRGMVNVLLVVSLVLVVGLGTIYAVLWA